MERQLLVDPQLVDPHQTCTRSPGNIPAPRTYRETSGQDDNCYEIVAFTVPQQNRVTVANVRTGMPKSQECGFSTAEPCVATFRTRLESQAKSRQQTVWQQNPTADVIFGSLATESRQQTVL